ncbi:hypothetical protein ACHAWC_011183 [Mediolabrus comicus]
MEALEKDSKGNATVIELTQCGLIDRIIANLGLDNGRSYNADTPALATPLVKDEDGDPCIEEFSYAAVVCRKFHSNIFGTQCAAGDANHWLIAMRRSVEVA